MKRLVGMPSKLGFMGMSNDGGCGNDNGPQEITEAEYENGEPCARCGHDCLDHDDEFGNCTALPNPYGMNQRDGCDCEGYCTAEEMDTP